MVLALRVSQLEADDLDEYMTALIADQIIDAFSLVQPIVSDWAAEVRSAVRFLLCGSMLYSTGISGPAATFGAKLYGLELLPTSKLKFLTALCLLGYTRDRLTQKRSTAPAGGSRSLLSALSGALSLAELLNLLAFLRHGRRAGLSHRLLGARWGHPPGPARLYQPAAFAFVDRELVWHSFAELASSAAGALADVRRLLSAGRPGGSSAGPGCCSLCGQEACLPTLCSADCRCPVEAAACCYFCLAARLPYSCPGCSAKADSAAALVPLRGR